MRKTITLTLFPGADGSLWNRPRGYAWRGLDHRAAGCPEAQGDGLYYTAVLKLEADNGHWEGDAVKDGKTYEIRVDPHSGALTKNEPKH